MARTYGIASNYMTNACRLIARCSSRATRCSAGNALVGSGLLASAGTGTTRTRAAGGSGLGLSIVKYVAEAHGGRVGVQSEIGVGTTFTMLLPLDRTLPYLRSPSFT